MQELPENEQLTPEQQTQVLKLQSFMTKFKDAIENWCESHPIGVKPPIVWNDYYQDFIWLNRKQRRDK